MYLIVFICTCLFILTVLSICAQRLSELRASVLSYGKLNLHNDSKPTTDWATYLSRLLVPKHYFSHFYVVGLLTAVISIIELIAWTYYKRPLFLVMSLQHYDIPIASQHVSRQQCVLGLMLMTIHLSRRVYESFWIEKPSKTATMHVSHYLAGIGFYGAMVLGTWLEGASSAFDLWQIHPDHVKSHTIPAITAILLFTYASYHQYHCHVILASLRKHTDTTYTIPRGDWFEYIVTPHYFADILIYLSLCILYGFQNYIVLCGFLWTIVNLSIVASETNTWYHTHFGSKYNQTFPDGRWKIIPGCY